LELKSKFNQARQLETKGDGNTSYFHDYLPFILVRLVVVFVPCCWDRSVSDSGVSGGEEISLPSLLFLASNNLSTVMIGILWLFEGME
jgi:hypothetical protein